MRYNLDGRFLISVVGLQVPTGIIHVSKILKWSRGDKPDPRKVVYPTWMNLTNYVIQDKVKHVAFWNICYLNITDVRVGNSYHSVVLWK